MENTPKALTDPKSPGLIGFNMPHHVVGQVGINVKTSITGVRNQTRCGEYVSIKMEGPIL